jgi:hypothetical protein
MYIIPMFILGGHVVRFIQLGVPLIGSLYICPLSSALETNAKETTKAYNNDFRCSLFLTSTANNIFKYIRL